MKTENVEPSKPKKTLGTVLLEGWYKWVAAIIASVLTLLLGWAGGLFTVAIDEATRRLIADDLAGRVEFVSDIAAVVSDRLMPIGSIIAWPVAEPPPGNWHVCDGSEIELKGHEILASVIGNVYGKSSVGRLTLPNFTNQFLRGFGESTKPFGEQQPCWATLAHREGCPWGQQARSYL